MRLLLAAVLTAAISGPCMAASENQSEDKTSADVQTPGITEPRTPDTLKSAPDQRIRTEGQASSSEQGRGVKPPPIVEERN
jgi:hypothetical protein